MIVGDDFGVWKEGVLLVSIFRRCPIKKPATVQTIKRKRNIKHGYLLYLCC